MRPTREVRGDKAAKVHYAKGDPSLRTTRTACLSFAAQDVPSTTDINHVSCSICLRRATYR